METVLSRSKNDLYIVMRRGALRTIVGTACSAVMLALALGVALGHSRTEAPRVYREPPRPAVAAAPYTAAEFARLQAANASLDARVERLATQLDTLSAFDQRLRARLPRANATSTAASARASYGGAMGGPELPPRPCSAAGALSTPQVTRAELDCISTTVDALEQGAASHEAAWKAFPGRRPIAFGRTSSLFGNRLDPFTHHLSFHPGIDMAAPMGTPILAAAGGRVTHAGPMPGYGNAVEIDHGNGVITRYAHASKIEVRVGERVQPGEPIAEVGSTGRSTGPHLHFEVRVDDRAVDPADYLALFAGNDDLGSRRKAGDAKRCCEERQS
ncbi:MULTISPECIES: M23 family metallopeptidase [unclassified Caballeronia]|uniref:M23 family metallopeptidase n=1 Tax=unclassified Caballeronia TaxID=2646786 RepID=UPI001F1C51A3|nr:MULTISPECIES: M23 family metallopeptidase [unclassified Caballeronia]MCE4545102.1 M23 family metallopeptidase [Caballeronia sp. PC1]MCE4570527.1 M23 family metallopeptidase [Caballeronia sp. CLC5]